MRSKLPAAVALAVMALGLASPKSAHAFDFDRPDIPRGWYGTQAVRHWVYYPRYHHFYMTNQADPYAYQYQASGYYPFRNSAYWKARNCVPVHRASYVHPTYAPAWGAPKTRVHRAKAHAHHVKHAHDVPTNMK